MPLDDDLTEAFSDAQEILAADDVLEARQRGLRGKSIAIERVSLEEHLVDGIVTEAGGIVGVGIAAGDGEDPLTEKLDEFVVDLAGLPSVAKAFGKALRQSQLPIGGLEQDGAAVGATPALVEAGDEGLVEEIRKEQPLWNSRIIRARSLSSGESSMRCGTGRLERSDQLSARSRDSGWPSSSRSRPHDLGCLTYRVREVVNHESAVLKMRWSRKGSGGLPARNRDVVLRPRRRIVAP
jgi:hypothetical protein